MIEFVLALKEKNEFPHDIVSRDFEGKAGSELFYKVTEKYADYLVMENNNDQPLLYMKLFPTVTGSDRNMIFGSMPIAYFKPEILEEMVEFIEKN
ncbi:hypothetical protein [Pseudalkalibacillus sp. JSM 102089]|uniref:hypothetical protein n=1 Tax=Pseudalkalibacillus sp. JSM 102089 TaxID=3229856 RepID=UPI00352409EA